MPHESLYFAHPINTYGTELEKYLLDALRGCGLARRIVNPNTPQHHAACHLLMDDGAKWGMDYFTSQVLPSCAALVFFAFGDGKISAGVALEIETAMLQGSSIYEITTHIEGTTIRPLRGSDFEALHTRRLSIEETRERLYADGEWPRTDDERKRTIRPYA